MYRSRVVTNYTNVGIDARNLIMDFYSAFPNVDFTLDLEKIQIFQISEQLDFLDSNYATLTSSSEKKYLETIEDLLKYMTMTKENQTSYILEANEILSDTFNLALASKQEIYNALIEMKVPLMRKGGEWICQIMKSCW